MKVFCAPFMCLQFGFVIFGPKDLGAKAANKMLVKLTSGGSGVLAHVLQLLFREKNHKIINNSQTLKIVL